jgi:hypothetical protein
MIEHRLLASGDWLLLRPQGATPAAPADGAAEGRGDRGGGRCGAAENETGPGADLLMTIGTIALTRFAGGGKSTS